MNKSVFTSDVSSWATTVWNDIQNAFGHVKGWFATTFSGIGDTISKATGDAATWDTNAWENIKESSFSWYKSRWCIR